MFPNFGEFARTAGMDYENEAADEILDHSWAFWIALEIVIDERVINVYDCNQYVAASDKLDGHLRPMAVWLPIHLDKCSIFPNFKSSPFRIHRVPELVHDTTGYGFLNYQTCMNYISLLLYYDDTNILDKCSMTLYYADTNFFWVYVLFLCICRSSCGVFTLKAIEALVFGGDVKAITNEKLFRYRELMCSDLIKESWSFKF